MWLWNPAREIQRLEDEMMGLFSGVSGAVHQFPPVNMWTDENEIFITAELPGVEANAIDIAVVGDELTLRGARTPLRLNDGEEFHRSERMQGQFVRTVQLPFRTDATRVQAKIEKGILTIALPRAEEDKPRRIQIKAA